MPGGVGGPVFQEFSLKGLQGHLPPSFAQGPQDRPKHGAGFQKNFREQLQSVWKGMGFAVCLASKSGSGCVDSQLEGVSLNFLIPAVGVHMATGMNLNLKALPTRLPSPETL